jgi:hypothetical protein
MKPVVITLVLPNVLKRNNNEPPLVPITDQRGAGGVDGIVSGDSPVRDE